MRTLTITPEMVEYVHECFHYKRFQDTPDQRAVTEYIEDHLTQVLGAIVEYDVDKEK